MGSRRGRHGLLIGLVLAAATALTGVLLAGPLPFPTVAGRPLPVTPPPAPSGAPQPLPRGVSPVVVAGAQTTAAVASVLVVALVLAGLVVLVVWLARRTPRPREPEGDPRDETTQPGGEGSRDTAIAPQAVHRGLVRALELLDEPGDADDAVVQAWLGLEDAAVEAGAPRHPAETPSEYAARIIRRFEADREAADELRGLYERVRFGGRAAGHDDIRLARRCLTRLLASWSPAVTR